MNRRTLALTGALIAGLAIGCESKPAPTATVSTAPTVEAIVTATMNTAALAPSAAASGKLANCPNTVEGATTAFKDVEDGVEITVTAKDDAAAKDIRARAKHIADASKEETATAKQHNGSGTGSGTLGRCPVVAHNTLIETADVEGGTKITIKSKDATEVDWLRREARERQGDLGVPSVKEAVPGKMSHCPSAITSSTTAVKDSKDGVIVTITAKAEADTNEIRDRAKYVVDAAKKDATGGKRDGDGNGGGGLGRCPVVVKDTTVEAKDVPGGSEFTVKPEKAADLAALRKETRDRVENFSLGGGKPGRAKK